MPDQHEPVVSEAVAVFHDVSHLEAAVEELRAAGFGKHDISLLASEHAVNRKLGHRYERVEELETIRRRRASPTAPGRRSATARICSSARSLTCPPWSRPAPWSPRLAWSPPP